MEKLTEMLLTAKQLEELGDKLTDIMKAVARLLKGFSKYFIHRL